MLRIEIAGADLEDVFVELTQEKPVMSALGAVVYREARIRATNLLFVFWDIAYPIGYLLVFGVGVSGSFGFTAPGLDLDYNAFFLGGVLTMASFGIARTRRGPSSWIATAGCTTSC